MNFWDLFSSKRLLAAHRGYRAIRPENTLAAFEASIGCCDFIELDVGFSSDGVPIIIHDDSLERTSNVREAGGFSPPYTVSDYSYEALKKLDVSSWFLISDPFGTIANSSSLHKELGALAPESIPTLSETLALLKRYNMPVNIEIKDMRGTALDSVATAKTLEQIYRFGMEERVLLSSFNHHYMQEAKILAPEICRAALQEKAHPDNLIAYLRDLDVTCYHPELEITDESVVKSLVQAGFIVNVFTVNDPQMQAQLFDWGVRTVFSDYCRQPILGQ